MSNPGEAEKSLKEFDDTELSVRLEYVEKIYKCYEEAQGIIDQYECSASVSSDSMVFMSLFFEVKAKLTRQISEVRRTVSNQRSSIFRQFSCDESPSHATPRRTKIPEIQLPKFNGEYSEWPNFYSLFSTVINDNGELSALEKFHYLRSSLGESALDTIASLELNETNYEEALLLLKNRFDNKLLNFQGHIKEIFELNCVDNGSANDLRRLSDKVNAHLRAMQTIADQQQIVDGLLIHLVSSKLDTKSKMKWEESLETSVLPTWASMAAFLERRCRMAENLENATTKPLIVSKRLHQHRHVHLSTSTSSTTCSFCDSKDHFITNCPRFSNLSPVLRLEEAKKSNLCLNCLRKGHRLADCRSRTCRHCSRKHHSLLHFNYNKSSQGTTNGVPASSVTQSTLVSSLSPKVTPEARESPTTNNVLLATAIVLVKNIFGVFVPCRAILDSASQLNFVTSRLAKQLQLKTKSSCFSISGIGDGTFTADKSAHIVVQSCYDNYSIFFDAVVIPKITDYQPNSNFDVNLLQIPGNVKLADPEFHKRGRIDILIGAGLFFELMSVGQIRLGQNSTILQKTRLGWVVSGGVATQPISCSLATTCREAHEAETLDDVIKSFWKIENNFESKPDISFDDALCEKHFRQNITRLGSGEYSINLPKKLDIFDLGDSHGLAHRRFLTLEKKLSKHPDIKNQYISFMDEYLNLNHMSLLTTIPKNVKVNFLPHHCVHKEDSTTTKLRVVFDGSAKTTSGLSLNDILHSGPTIQPKLFNTLLRFRFFKIALSGDICKMYRCVRVSHPDDFLQCILWRNNPNDDVKIYKLNTITYGTKPAAFLAIRAMHQLAMDEENSFPIGAKIVRRDFYVDDLISGGNSVQEVIKVRQQVTQLLKQGNFVIRKWCSNDAGVLKDVSPSDREKYLKFQDGTDITKTLGILWDPNADAFIFTFNHVLNSNTISKRTVLSSIARFYDPLGLVGPVITQAKVFMQSLWKSQLNWDESLPQNLHSVWQQFVSTFSLVNKFTFPRFVSIPDSTVQIHAFCDASLSAYGACIYVRAESGEEVKINLLCSKSRVAPLKALTVPKLELSAALLLAELLNEVSNTLENKFECHCWSDSMVVLSWLREESSNYNVFVANRVSRIQNLTKNMSWHHVPTAMNPADILSRGATPKELLNSNLWKEGPNFLRQPSKDWPNTFNFITDLPERRRTTLVTSFAMDFYTNCKYHDSFSKMQRIFAYVNRFFKFKKGVKYSEELTPQDLKEGIRILIRNIQRVHFAVEYKPLQRKESILPSSKMYSLAPFMDSEGLIRVGGRLQHSYLNFEAQHPIILPKHHPITTSMALHYHQQLLHAGPQSLLAYVRQQYWPIGGRKTISSIINKCVKCFRLRPKISQHIMGSLPADRVRPSRAFCTTGIDFCGPFYYKSEVRTRSPLKCYICIFICFSTKAVHMELVQDLSTSSFLASLKRFISTRGKPNTIWSDNATNFVGAKNELAELRQLFFDQKHEKEVRQQCLQDGINWKFIPPRSPHFGGLWESAVKSAKYHFYRAVGQSVLTFDELRTLVCQISAILNSRPQCPISEDPDDLEVLTPAHFLVGAPLTTLLEPDITELKINRLSRWQHICHIQQTFWKKWSSSYLSLLQERHKWQSTKSKITKGTMVIVKEEGIPPMKWHLGRVVDVIPGKDDVVRVVLVKTSNNISRIAVAKLAVLPIEDHSVESHSLPTGGGC